MPARQHVRLHVGQSRISDQFLQGAAQPVRRHREARAFATTCDRLGPLLGEDGRRHPVGGPTVVPDQAENRSYFPAAGFRIANLRVASLSLPFRDQPLRIGDPAPRQD
jgi:hypothetical protein